MNRVKVVMNWLMLSLMVVALVVAIVLLTQLPALNGSSGAGGQPTSNPIVEENKKPGTGDWKSPNQENYIQTQIAQERDKVNEYKTRTP
jgi:hypothetical protein